MVFLYAGEADHVIGAGVGSSSFAIEDSRTLWDQIWDNRDILTEICHSHPNGPSNLSSVDMETARAVCVALGRPLFFSIVHPGGYLRREVFPSGQCGPDLRLPVRDEPWWTKLLWQMSKAFMPRNSSALGAGKVQHDGNTD